MRTFVVEAVDSVDAGALVIAPQDEEIFRVFDLVGEKEAYGLERLFASINVVAEEEIVGFRRESAVLEESQEVIVLTVYITWKRSEIAK